MEGGPGMETLQEGCYRVVRQVEKAVIGKSDAIRTILKAMLCGGHVLLEDVPGVGKTLLVKALTRALGLTFRRIQFTADMFPSDLTGTSVFQPSSGQFEFVPGPLFSPVVLADELNRANPKTQSALLEAMEERRITVDGKSYELPEPFLVLATQNPLEYEGTYPLPEAQLDRFLFRIRLGYPSREEEMGMLERVRGGDPLLHVEPALTLNELKRMQKQVRDVYVHDKIRSYIVALSQATRKEERLVLGASPRASVALMRAAQSEAWFSGRDYVVPDDVKAMFLHVMGHRVRVADRFGSFGVGMDHHPYSDRHFDGERILEEIVESVEVPAFSPVSA